MRPSTVTYAEFSFAISRGFDGETLVVRLDADALILIQ